MAAYQTIELARFAPSPGDGRRLELELEPGSFELGGHRYDAEPAEIPARLEVSRTASGYALHLSFDAHLEGPCMRCLGDARAAVAVDAREVDQPGTDDEELRSPYVTEGELDLAAWAHDALLLALPPAAALPARMRRALPGMRRIAQRRRSRRPRSPARAGSALGEAARAPIATIPRPDGRPEEANLLAAPRQAPRDPYRGEAAPERVSALSQPASAPSRLPRLRHLRGARGDRARARRSRLGELMRAARATGSR